MNDIESVIQATTVSMIRTLYPDLVLNLSLNGISLNGLSPQQKAQIIRQVKIEGMENGVQDLSIYLPNSVVLNLEFKTSKGKQSEDQVLIQNKLINLGHNYHLVRTPYEVFDLIAQYTSVQYREGAFNQLPIPYTNNKLIQKFLHFPKNTELATVQQQLKKLYRI